MMRKHRTTSFSTPPTRADRPPLAYSYVRFSSPEQAEGDSLRRQTERAADYCRRHHLTLDTSLTLHDLGVSAARGQNAAVGNFRAFLDAVRGGRVPNGSVLIVESFDRISRQGIDEGYDLIKGILKAGITIVTLSPERRFDRDAVRGLTKGALEIQLILDRAAEESELKSDRIGRAWRQKKKQATAGELVTRTVPAWVRVTTAGRLELIPERAAVVKRIYRLAIEGQGRNTIAKRLTADGVPPFDQSAKSWSGPAVAWILTTRAVIGEYQPKRDRSRTADGEPVPNYYPAAVSPKTFHAARAAISLRLRHPVGRRGTDVGIFSGLLKDARDGSAIVAVKKRGKRVLLSLWATQGREGSKYVAFPWEVFERQVLDELEELDPKTVLPDDTSGEDELAVRGELEKVRGLIERLKEKVNENPDLDSLIDSMRRQEKREKDLAGQLEEVRRTAAVPLRGAWKEYKSVVKIMDDAPPEKKAEVRLRVRAAVRGIVGQVWCVFCSFGPLNRDRLAILQVWFHGGYHREYGIIWPADGRADPYCESFVFEDDEWSERFRFDLRDRAKAVRFVKIIESAVADELQQADDVGPIEHFAFPWARIVSEVSRAVGAGKKAKGKGRKPAAGK